MIGFETAARDVRFIVGGAGSGKSTRLRELARQAGDKALAVAASPAAAEALAAGLGGCGVRVTTARQVALAVLADPRARQACGRAGTMLAPCDENALAEDLKTTGMRSRRLRELFRFLQRGWSELADDDPEWLMTHEERDVAQLAREALCACEGVLECEAAALAVRVLRAEPAMAREFGAACVLADDFTCMSRASQVLVCLLAGEQLAIAADPVGCAAVFDSYPYAAGLAEAQAAFADAAVERLDASHRSAASAHAAAVFAQAAGGSHDVLDGPAEGDAAEAPAGLRAVESETPEDEAAFIAEQVRAALAAGTDPTQIVVAAPTTRDAARFASALDGAGVAVRTMRTAAALGADLRDPERSVVPHVFTALELLADDACARAWRTWLGYGDYLAGSKCAAELRARTQAEGRGFVDVLHEAADAGRAPDMFGAPHVAQRVRAFEALRAQVAGLAGGELLDAVTRAVSAGRVTETPAAMLRICQPEPTDDAAALAARARAVVEAPTFGAGAGVRVGVLPQFVGLEAQLLVVGGWVSGLLPAATYFDLDTSSPNHQQIVFERETRLLACILGKSAGEVLLTRFAHCPAALAASRKLTIARVRSRDRRPEALVAPSEWLGLLGPARG